MSNLTETAFYTRKIINWAIVVLILYIIGQFIFTVVIRNVRLLIPKKPLKPDNALGVLPPIVFPVPINAKGITYRLGTFDGTIPVASDTAKVYFMPKERPNFLGLSKAKTQASQLGFKAEPVQKSATEYEWSDPTTPLRTLTMDIISRHINFSYNYAQDLSLFTVKPFSSESKAISDATDFLRRNGLLPFDVDAIHAQVTPLRIQSNVLVSTDAIKEADAARIDFFRNPIEKAKVITPDPTRGIISLTLSGASNEKKVIELRYRYWPVSYDLLGRYAIVQSKIAWNKLQNGEGFIAQNPNNLSEVTIRKVNVGYLDTYESQVFLQPVFIFEGDNDFVAYVPAIVY